MKLKPEKLKKKYWNEEKEKIKNYTLQINDN